VLKFPTEKVLSCVVESRDVPGKLIQLPVDLVTIRRLYQKGLLATFVPEYDDVSDFEV
jgi:hypothetical protein